MTGAAVDDGLTARVHETVGAVDGCLGRTFAVVETVREQVLAAATGAASAGRAMRVADLAGLGLAGLEVDHLPLEAVGHAQDLLGVAGALADVVLLARAHELQGEHARDDHQHERERAKDRTGQAGAERGPKAVDPWMDGDPHGSRP